MAEAAAWVGRCLIHTQPEADEPHEHPWNAQCYAAVWTETSDGFTQAVRDHCQAQGHYLVWAEQVLPILDWLHRHGHHNTLIDLAKTVDGNHGIALSPLLPRGEAGQPPPQPTYLEITEHAIPPLPDQSDKPRWEQDWITSERGVALSLVRSVGVHAARWDSGNGDSYVLPGYALRPPTLPYFLAGSHGTIGSLKWLDGVSGALCIRSSPCLRGLRP